MGCNVSCQKVPVWAVLLFSIRYGGGCIIAFKNVKVWAALLFFVTYQYGLQFCFTQCTGIRCTVAVSNISECLTEITELILLYGSLVKII
jgi:hypothetical protein